MYGLKRMNVTNNAGTEIMLGTSLVLNLRSSVMSFSFTYDIPCVSAVCTMAVLAYFMYLVVFSLEIFFLLIICVFFCYLCVCVCVCVCL